MLSLSPGAESLRQITDQLQLHQQAQLAAGPDTKVIAALGMPDNNIQYLGYGREIQAEGTSFGIYARTFKDVNLARSTTHELYLEFLSPARQEAIRRSLGRINMVLYTDGRMHVQGYRFGIDMESTTPPRAIAAHLGNFAATLAMRSTADALDCTPLPRRNYHEPTPEDFTPLQAFLDNPKNQSLWYKNLYKAGHFSGFITAAMSSMI